MTATSRASASPTDLHMLYVSVGLLVVLGCLLMLGMALVADTARGVERYRPAIARALVPPQPDDAAVLLNNTPLAIAPVDALTINAARKLDRVRLAAARPFLLDAALTSRPGVGAALECLTKAVYYEAASESDAGERAVAQVVLNRVRNPLFPQSVCGVVFQGSALKTGCQFSFTCDGSLARTPSATGWARARRIAAAALAGHVERAVGLSTHYHANYVVPYWASSLDKVATLGAHIFYTMRGRRGQPGAFRAAYDAAAESPPTLALDPAQLDGLAGADAVAGGPDAKPRDRTVLAEDALGAPSAAAQAMGPAAGSLRVDEHRGELVADRREAVLDGGR